MRPWSTVLHGNSADGRVWLKAPCAAARFEPQLATLLAEHFPASCPAPLAIDSDRGWLLSADHGAVLGDEGDPARWRELLELAARLQRACVTLGPELLDVGLPDHSPARLATHYDDALRRLAALPDAAAHRPTRAELEQLSASRSTVIRAAARLQASGFPCTWQHGDLHPANALRGDGHLRLLDFGDGQWAHPFELLAVPEECLARDGQPEFNEVIPSYLDAWECSSRAFAELRSALRVSYAVNRATTWLGCLAEATPAEWDQWGNAPLDYLRRIPTARFT